jgi:hypothetical protein
MALVGELKMGTGSWNVVKGELSRNKWPACSANEKQVRGMISPDRLYCLIIS